MAKPPIFRRIIREDLPDAPDWVDIFIYSLNQFFDTVRLAMSRNLTFSENNDMQTQRFRLVAGAAATDNTYNFALNMKKKVDGIILGRIEQVSTSYAPLTSVPWINWHQESSKLVIDSILGLTTGVSYDFTITLY